MATKYGAEIDDAAADIAEAGAAAVLSWAATGAVFDASVGAEVLTGTGGPVKGTEAVLGSVSASAADKRFTVSSGDLTALGFAVGQTIQFRRVAIENMGPFTVSAVTAATLTVAETVADMAAVSTFSVFATAGVSTETVQALEVSPISAVGTAALAEAKMNVEEAAGFLVAAKGVAHAPAPGDRIAFGGRDYTVRIVRRLAPDGTPILWKLAAES